MFEVKVKVTDCCLGFLGRRTVVVVHDWVAAVTEDGEKFVYDRNGGRNYFDVVAEGPKFYVTYWSTMVVVVGVMIFSMISLDASSFAGWLKGVVAVGVFVAFVATIFLLHGLIFNSIKPFDNHYSLDDAVNLGLWEYVKSGGNSELLPDLLEASRSDGFVPVGLMAELLESVEGDAEKADLVVKLFKDVFAVVPVNDVEKADLVATLFMLNDELKSGGFDKNVIRENFLQVLSKFKGFAGIADEVRKVRFG